MSVEKPLVYLILGSAGSGRREVLADLLAGGLADDARATVLISDTERASDAEAALTAPPRVTPGSWRWEQDAIVASAGEGATHIFFLADGRGDPIDQIEAFKPWLESQGGELARVICVVDCGLAEKNPPLLAWFDACVHFADVVLLNRRDGVANKWLSEFQRHYANQFFPCLFEFVKDGRVKNPGLVLEPQARRMSHVFDEEQDWIFTDEEGEEIDEDEESATEGEEEVGATPEVEPYFVRDAAGRRSKRIPEITRFLAP